MNTTQAIKNFVRSRPRLSIAFLLGILVFLALPVDVSMVTRALFGWNVTVWFYLALVAWLMSGASHESVRKIAQEEDESALAVLVILSVSCALSLLAIIYELASMQGVSMNSRFLNYLFTGVTVIGSWCLLGIVFTFHYALLYYNSSRQQRALRFPDEDVTPNYWDFLYFSFTIAVALQTSDIVITSRQMRKTVLAHSILSFFFNAAILGFSINIAASLVGN
ncbi:MAG: DUF1345 domain-containing protein [Undibacterium sp.]|nr:DUF1345 domain-containing protein [Undibacterium sp.]